MPKIIKVSPPNLSSIETLGKEAFEKVQFGGDFYRMIYSPKLKNLFEVPVRTVKIEVVKKGAYTQINRKDEGVDFYGQCVCFVKALCQLTTSTKTWQKGVQVGKTTTIERGTLIATFFGKDGIYGGHTGIFLGRYTNPITQESGIHILDQNWYENSLGNEGTVGLHRIPFNGKNTVLNAENYFVVNI